MTRSQRTLHELQKYESRNITYQDPMGGWPIVWARAKGCHVWDEEGVRYLDLTAAFGVAAAGHANPKVVRAGQRQMERLLHAMGDVHPHALKAQLARKLSEVTWGRWGAGHAKVVFGSSGFEAVEAALKTAFLATGKPGVLAFEGGYHGVGYGTLNVTHRGHFRDPFQTQLGRFGRFAPFPIDETPVASRRSLEVVRTILRAGQIGAILVEPMQARGGVRVPHADWIFELRALANKFKCLLILDEIYTGFGRIGAWFATERSRVIPDVICLGKALTGGFPLSACVGKADIMDKAWPASQGEAIHTSTFLGHPVGCAMALAQIAEVSRLRLPTRAAKTGAHFKRHLEDAISRQEWPRHWKATVRGLGLMLGVEMFYTADPGSHLRAGAAVVAATKVLLTDFRIIALPEGACGEVLGLTPPLTLPESSLRRAAEAIVQALAQSAAEMDD